MHRCVCCHQQKWLRCSACCLKKIKKKFVVIRGAYEDLVIVLIFQNSCHHFISEVSGLGCGSSLRLVSSSLWFPPQLWFSSWEAAKLVTALRSRLPEGPEFWVEGWEQSEVFKKAQPCGFCPPEADLPGSCGCSRGTLRTIWPLVLEGERFLWQTGSVIWAFWRQPGHRGCFLCGKIVSLCQKLGITLHYLRNGRDRGSRRAHGESSLPLDFKNLSYVDFTLKKPCAIYALEVMGLWRWQESQYYSLSSAFSNSWRSQKIHWCSFCVSAWYCRSPSSWYLCKIVRVHMKSHIFGRRSICFHFTLPPVVFVLHLDFWLFIQSSNVNIWHAPGASSNNDLRKNEVHLFFLDNCMEE